MQWQYINRLWFSTIHSWYRNCSYEVSQYFPHCPPPDLCGRRSNKLQEDIPKADGRCSNSEEELQ